MCITGTIGSRPVFVGLGVLFLLPWFYSMATLVESPARGMLLSLISLPCVLRTICFAAHRSAVGHPLTAQEWFATLLGYVGVVVFVGVPLFAGMYFLYGVAMLIF